MRQSNRLVARVVVAASLFSLGCESDGARSEPRSTAGSTRMKPSAFAQAAEHERLDAAAGPAREGAGARGSPRTPLPLSRSGHDDAGLWAACYARFRAGAGPRADVTRLGMLCGPSNGMTRAGPIVTGSLDEDEDAVVRDVGVASPECWRVFAAAGGSVQDLEIEVLAKDGGPLVLVNLDVPWAVAPRSSPLCLRRSGSYQLRLRTHTGQGDYAAQIWRYKM